METPGGSETTLDWLAERWRWRLGLASDAGALQRLIVVRAVDLEDATGWLRLLRVGGGQLPDPREIDRDTHTLGPTTDDPVLVVKE